MGPLASTLLAVLPHATGARASTLDVVLQRLVEEGARAWPGIRVDPARFVRYVGERCRERDIEDGFASLNVAGLYLACACADGNSSAIAAFEQRYLRACDRALAKMSADPSFPDEVKQDVRAKLFVASAENRPKIADYGGRGDLAAFVRVLVMRHAISLQRKVRRVVALDGDMGAPESLPSLDPELLYLRTNYQAEFAHAFHDAIAALSSEERNLLRYHYVDGLNIDHIGAIYGIHRVSAARRLTKVRQALVVATRRLLGERLRLDATTELESILRLIESEVDVSLRRVLGEVFPSSGERKLPTTT